MFYRVIYFVRNEPSVDLSPAWGRFAIAVKPSAQSYALAPQLVFGDHHLLTGHEHACQTVLNRIEHKNRKSMQLCDT